MNRIYDSFTDTVTVTATAKELYDNIHTRHLLPDAVRADLDRERRMLSMTPEELRQFREAEKNFLSPEARGLLG